MPEALSEPADESPKNSTTTAARPVAPLKPELIVNSSSSPTATLKLCHDSFNLPKPRGFRHGSEPNGDREGTCQIAAT